MTDIASRVERSEPKLKLKWDMLLAYLLLVCVSVVVLIPLVWMLLSSLKTLNEVYDFSWLPKVPQFRNYPDGLEELQFKRYFLNSIVITVTNVVFGSLVASMSAYAFARLDFRGKNILFALVISTMMLPFAAIMIPSFVLFRYLGWINTYAVMTIPLILAVPAFYIFLMRQFFLTIPRELDDAAKIDACSFYKIFWYILFPLPPVVIFFIFQRYFIKLGSELSGLTTK